MTISITATNLDLTPALKDYAEKRMRGIEKFIGMDAVVHVELNKTTAHHKQGDIYGARAIISTALGKQYVATSEKADMYEAIDDVRNEIVASLKHERGRRDSLLRRGSQRLKKLLRGR